MSMFKVVNGYCFKKIIASLLIVSMVLCSNGIQTLATDNSLIGNAFVKDKTSLEEYYNNLKDESSTVNDGVDDNDSSNDEKSFDEQDNNSDGDASDNENKNEEENEEEGNNSDTLSGDVNNNNNGTEGNNNIINKDGNINNNNNDNTNNDVNDSVNDIDEDLLISGVFFKDFIVCSECSSENIESVSHTLNIFYCKDCDNYFQMGYGQNEKSILSQIEEKNALCGDIVTENNEDVNDDIMSDGNNELANTRIASKSEGENEGIKDKDVIIESIKLDGEKVASESESRNVKIGNIKVASESENINVAVEDVAIANIEMDGHGNSIASKSETKLEVLYSIDYDLKGGDWVDGYTPKSSRKFAEEVVLATASVISKEGYKFVAWCESRTDNEVYMIESNSEKNFELEAKWEPIQYKVKYIVNGNDEASPSSFIKTYGIDYTNFIIPINDECGFVKWCETDVEFDDGVLNGNEKVLFGSNLSNTSTKSDTTLVGFDGWYEDEDCNKKYDGRYDLTSFDGEEVRIYCKLSSDETPSPHHHTDINKTFSCIKSEDDVEEGYVIYLGDNVTFTKPIKNKLREDLYICLCGHQLTYDCDKPFIDDLNGHNVVITDCTYEETDERIGIIGEDITFRNITSSGKLVINKPIFTDLFNANYFLTAGDNSKVVIENIKIESGDVINGIVRIDDAADFSLLNVDFDNVQCRINPAIQFSGKELAFKKVVISDAQLHDNASFIKIMNSSYSVNTGLNNIQFSDMYVHDNNYNSGSFVSITDRNKVLFDNIIYASNSVANYLNGNSTNISISKSSVESTGYFYGINNNANKGGVFTLDKTRFTNKSNLSLINNYANDIGGAFYIKNDSVLDLSNDALSNSRMFENVSIYHGGVAYISKSTMLISNLCGEYNYSYEGGFLYATDESRIKVIKNVDLRNNKNAVHLNMSHFDIDTANTINDNIVFKYNFGGYLFYIADKKNTSSNKKSEINLFDCIIEENYVNKLFGQDSYGQVVTFGGNIYISKDIAQNGIFINDPKKDVYCVSDKKGLGNRATLSFICYNDAYTEILKNARYEDLRHVFVTMNKSTHKLDYNLEDKTICIKCKEKVYVRYFDSMTDVEYDCSECVSERAQYNLAGEQRQFQSSILINGSYIFAGWSKYKNIEYNKLSLLGRVLREYAVYSGDEVQDEEIKNQISLQDVKKYIKKYINNDSSKIRVISTSILLSTKSEIKDFYDKIEGSNKVTYKNNVYEIDLDYFINACLGISFVEKKFDSVAKNLLNEIDLIYRAGERVEGSIKDVAYYAVWGKNVFTEQKKTITYVITPNGSDITLEKDDESIYYGADYKIKTMSNEVLDLFGYSGFTLAGWAINGDIHNKLYNNQIITVTESLRLYPIFSKIYKDPTDCYITDIDVVASKEVRKKTWEKWRDGISFALCTCLVATYTLGCYQAPELLGPLSPILMQGVMCGMNEFVRYVDNIDGDLDIFKAWGVAIELSDLAQTCLNIANTMVVANGGEGSKHFDHHLLINDDYYGVYNSGKNEVNFFSGKGIDLNKPVTDDVINNYNEQIFNYGDFWVTEKSRAKSALAIKWGANFIRRAINSGITVSELINKYKEQRALLNVYDETQVEGLANEFYDYGSVEEYVEYCLGAGDTFTGEYGMYSENGEFIPYYTFVRDKNGHEEMITEQAGKEQKIYKDTVLNYYKNTTEKALDELQKEYIKKEVRAFTDSMVWMIDARVFNSFYSSIFGICDTIDYFKSNPHAISDDKDKQKDVINRLKARGIEERHIFKQNLNTDGNGSWVSLGYRTGSKDDLANAITDVRIFEIPRDQSLTDYATLINNNKTYDWYNDGKITNENGFEKYFMDHDDDIRFSLNSDTSWTIIPVNLNTGNETKSRTNGRENECKLYLGYKKQLGATPLNKLYITDVLGGYRIKDGVEQSFVMATNLSDSKGDPYQISHIGDTNYSKEKDVRADNLLPSTIIEPEETEPVHIKMVTGMLFKTPRQKVKFWDNHTGAVNQNIKFDNDCEPYDALELKDGITTLRKGASYRLPKLKDDGAYIFEGWSLIKNATKSQFDAGDIMSVYNEPMIYYAVYNKAVTTATIYLDAELEDVCYGVKMNKAGGSYRLADFPEREGYDFLGWANEKVWQSSTYIYNANEYVIDDGQVIEVLDTNKYMIDKNTPIGAKYYAIWKPRVQYLSGFKVESKVNNYINYSYSIDSTLKSKAKQIVPYDAMLNYATNITTTTTYDVDDAITDVMIVKTDKSKCETLPKEYVDKNGIVYKKLEFKVENDYKNFAAYKRQINKLADAPMSESAKVRNTDKTLCSELFPEFNTSDLNIFPNRRYVHYGKTFIGAFHSNKDNPKYTSDPNAYCDLWWAGNAKDKDGKAEIFFNNFLNVDVNSKIIMNSEGTIELRYSDYKEKGLPLGIMDYEFGSKGQVVKKDKKNIYWAVENSNNVNRLKDSNLTGRDIYAELAYWGKSTYNYGFNGANNDLIKKLFPVSYQGNLERAKDTGIVLYYTKDRRVGGAICDFKFAGEKAVANKEGVKKNLYWCDTTGSSSNFSITKTNNIVNFKDASVTKDDKDMIPSFIRVDYNKYFTVKFVPGADDVEGYMQSISQYEGLTVPIVSKYKRSGYLFDYFVDEKGNKYYNYMDTIRNNTTIDHDATLTAVWVKIGKIKFDYERVSGEKITGNMPELSVKINNEKIILPPNQYNFTNEGRKRYTFAYWELSVNGKVFKYENEGSFLWEPIIKLNGNIGSVVLMAKWNKSHKVTYNLNVPSGAKLTGSANSEDYVNGNYVLLGNSANCEGYKFMGWAVGKPMYSGTSYNWYTFNTEKERNDFESNNPEAQVSKRTKENGAYKIYMKTTSGVLALPPTYKITVDCDLDIKAVWRKWVTIKYNGNGATAGGYSVEQRLINTTYKLNSNNFAKNNDYFNCWKDQNGKTYSPGNQITLKGDYTFSVVWDPGYIKNIKIGDEKDDFSKDGYKKLATDLNKGAGGKFIYLWYTTTKNKKEAIVDLRISSAGWPAADAQNAHYPGYTRIGYDLNKGAGGHYIYLWYRKSSTGKGAIQELRIDSLGYEQPDINEKDWYTAKANQEYEGISNLNEKAGGNYIYLRFKAPEREQFYIKDIVFYEKSGYEKINVDLNKDAGGSYIYLWYSTTTNPNEAITDLRISSAKKDKNAKNSGYTGYTRIDKDLNKGAGGHYIYLWYRKGGSSSGAIRELRVDALSYSQSSIGGWYTASATSKYDYISDLNKAAGGKFIYLRFKK